MKTIIFLLGLAYFQNKKEVFSRWKFTEAVTQIFLENKSNIALDPQIDSAEELFISSGIEHPYFLKVEALKPEVIRKQIKNK